MRTNHTSKGFIFIFFVLILSCTVSYGLIIPVPGALQDYAILSNGDLSTDNSIYATGKIGARNLIAGSFFASDGVSSGTTPVIEGLDTLSQFIADLNQLPAVPLGSNLNGLIISGGGYIVLQEMYY